MLHVASCCFVLLRVADTAVVASRQYIVQGCVLLRVTRTLAFANPRAIHSQISCVCGIKIVAPGRTCLQFLR